ncbi:MAG: hypothetical protein IIA61_09195 [Candidatus Marinimicrobia bacterium]|nr:hypothetical protein [Candidatus Neomarinimicrobiota bacterium]
MDAFKLAKLFRGSFIQLVHHSHDESRADFKRFVFTYHDATKQLTRCKNQIKPNIVNEGLLVRSKAVYSKEQRE